VGAHRPCGRKHAACRKHPAGHRRARRRNTIVRGGDDEGGAGGGRRGRRRGGARNRFGPLTGARRPREPARLADGAARPARTGQSDSEIGAAIGREFSHALLAVVPGLSEQERNSINSTMLGVVLVKRWARSKQRGRGGMRPTFVERPALTL